MADDKNLLKVKITINDDGKISKVEYPESGKIKTFTEFDLPLTGKHYGWSLSGYEKSGLDLEAFFAQTVNFATNDEGKKEHLNTLGIQSPELIKLDVGHWGAYHRSREYPHGSENQREFGIIENHHVWLCRFNGNEQVSATATAFNEANAQWAGKVVNSLAPGMGIDIIAHTPVTDCRSAELDDNKLYVIFPDFHLPEAMPDFPTEEKRNPNKDARKELRKLLARAQHRPGLIRGNWSDESEQLAIQQYLEDIHVDPGQSLPTAPKWPVKAGTYGFRKTVEFTPEQFLAEKAIVDREIMLTSTWFYARGRDWNKEAQDRDATASKDDDGDPTPAIELAHLLCAIKKVRNGDEKVGLKGAGDAIQVIQVGDLYELWLNHEFLYRHFAADPTYKVDKFPPPYYLIGNAPSLGDDYQYRMDRDWQDKVDSPSHNEKRYVFNGWPKLSMLHRYRIGDQHYAGLGADELKKELAINLGQKERLQQLLKERVDRVRAYTLNYPITAASIDLEGMPPALLDFEAYYRRTDDSRKTAGTYGSSGAPFDKELCFHDANGRREVFWNEMILDLFASLDFRNIGGNHDGYRADPLLNARLSAADKAFTVISDPGLWIEHSHRWDAYNRDGMAFGAGVANYVYYYFNTLCSKTAGSLEAWWTNQEQKSFVPGAALWFGIANFGNKLEWVANQGIPSSVKPFGVYVSGHTHSGSLARITFEFKPKPEPPDYPPDYGW